MSAINAAAWSGVKNCPRADWDAGSKVKVASTRIHSACVRSGAMGSSLRKPTDKFRARSKY